MIGNPFRPTPAGDASRRSWQSATVSQLAAAIYDERSFERLPLLADALEDAGCDDHELLAHLRDKGPHVRGCRALDQILGRE